MKAVKIAAVCLLLGATLFFAVYALVSEQEEAVPTIAYFSLEKSRSESSSSSSSSSSAFSSRSSSSRSRSSKSSSSLPSASPSSKSSKSSSSSSESSGIQLPLNINTATQEEFMQLDGVSEELARLFVLYRDLGGAYTDIRELLLIKQLSKATYDKIEPYIYCDPKDVQSNELQTSD